MTDKTILIVGTCDTKSRELAYMANRIKLLGGGVLAMDISVLGNRPFPMTTCFLVTVPNNTCRSGKPCRPSLPEELLFCYGERFNLHRRRYIDPEEELTTKRIVW